MILIGPNTTTFIVSVGLAETVSTLPLTNLQIPAEAFPTRYRCTCYGISAACGKLGSVLGQVVVIKVTRPKSLGVTLIT